jgi:hypothetical protein
VVNRNIFFHTHSALYHLLHPRFQASVSSWSSAAKKGLTPSYPQDHVPFWLPTGLNTSKHLSFSWLSHSSDNYKQLSPRTNPRSTFLQLWTSGKEPSWWLQFPIRYNSDGTYLISTK